MTITQIEDAMQLIRMEYAELPELKLTFWQAQRLWDLPSDVCARALATLMESRFLARAGDGSYVRGMWSGVRM
jgi:hypothetical protein